LAVFVAFGERGYFQRNLLAFLRKLPRPIWSFYMLYAGRSCLSYTQDGNPEPNPNPNPQH